MTAKGQKDQRNADLSWSKVSGSASYNIRWGIVPDKLYQTYQFWNDPGAPEVPLSDHPDRFELRALNVDVPYYLAVEAFNEGGVSGLSKVIGDGSGNPVPWSGTK